MIFIVLSSRMHVNSCMIGWVAAHVFRLYHSVNSAYSIEVELWNVIGDRKL